MIQTCFYRQKQVILHRIEQVKCQKKWQIRKKTTLYILYNMLSSINKQKNNKHNSYETLQTTIITYSFTIAGIAMLCNERHGSLWFQGG